MSDNNSYKNFEDVKCLWMKYGLVDYKLCDSDFNCEDCSFDSAIKMNLKNPTDNFIFERFFHKLPLLESFSPQYHHFDCGIVLKNFIGNNYYIGFEPYALKVSGGNCRIKYLNKKPEVAKNEKFIEFYGGWGKIDIKSPINFTYLENFDLNDILFSDKKWFGIIECKKDEIEIATIDRTSCDKKISHLKSMMSSNSPSYSDNFYSGINPAGGTMLDGGNFTDNLLFIFGAKVYRKLLSYIFLNSE